VEREKYSGFNHGTNRFEMKDVEVVRELRSNEL